MRDLNDKSTGGSLTADEWNDLPSEVQNIIEDLGQALSGGDLDQLGKAIAGMVGAADFYSETGAADAYVATKIGAKQGPAALDAVHDGLTVRFRPGNANTGASTLNVNGLGVKDIVREDLSVLSANDLVTTKDAICRYNQPTDDFHLLDYARAITFTTEVLTGHFVQIFADTITLDLSAAYPYDIETLIAITSVGSVDVTIQIDGVTVTGMSAVTVDSTEDTITASALNSVSVGETLTIIFANLTSSPADFRFTLKTTRTG